jgi:hypothetical protein
MILISLLKKIGMEGLEIVLKQAHLDKSINGVLKVIHKDLFGQKEEVEKKTFLSYDDISTKTRQKVIHAFSENVFYWPGGLTGYPYTDDYHKIMYEICKYKGIPCTSFFSDDKKDAINELLLKSSIEDFLRTIELFIYVRKIDKSPGSQNRLDKTIRDINDIFRIDKIGYEIVNERIIRKDSELLQEQVIKQTISLLYANDFKGPLEEFQEALNHYMLNEYEDTIHKANKAFESTMKSVLTKIKFDFNQKDTASKLIQKLCDNGIIYPYMQSLFQGLPTIRNDQGGHGQGLDLKVVNQSYAELSLNLAGSFIIFLVKRYHEQKK